MHGDDVGGVCGWCMRMLFVNDDVSGDDWDDWVVDGGRMMCVDDWSVANG